MKTLVIAVAMLGGVMLSGSAFAQDTITRERTVTEPGPGVSVGVPGVGVHIGGPAQVERRTTTTETVGSDADCRSKTVHREDGVGSTTIRKERCD